MKITIPKFPNSNHEPFLVTSPQTAIYNCIAWAYEDNTKWYWPDHKNLYFWPPDIPRKENIESFILLFRKIGYEICDNEALEQGYSKVAIYCDQHGKPTHAARQVEEGLWTSKLGQNIDVTHTIFSMSDGDYGNVAVYMKRKNNT